MLLRTPARAVPHPLGGRVAAALVFVTFLAAVLPAKTRAQYMYLDTNGDGYHTTADALAPAGVTSVDIWLRVKSNRDRSQGFCFSEDGQLALRSYEIILRAVGGTVAWGTFTNRLTGFNQVAPERSGPNDCHNSYSGMDSLGLDRYRLASISVTVLSGSPSLEIAPSTPLDAAFRTAFRADCFGAGSDRVMGIDWSDVDGAPWGAPPPGTVTLAQPWNFSLPEGTTADQALSAIDADGLPLTFTLESGPTFASVSTLSGGTGSASGSIHLAPGYADSGVVIAQVRASDGASSDAKSFVISVQNVNRAPAMKQPPDIMTSEGYVREQGVFAPDPDGDPVTFSKVDGPSYMTVTTVDSYYGLALMVFAPQFGDAGMTTGTVGATDGVLSATKTFNIMIRDTDRPPTLSVPSDLTAAEGTPVRFDVSAVDPDGDIVMLTTTGLPAGAAFLDGGEGSGTFQWVPAFDQAGEYAVVFTATGMPGAATTDTLTIVVTDVTAAIALAQPLDMSLRVGETADQQLNAMDQSGAPIQFTTVSGPSFMTITTVEAGSGLARGSVHLAPGAGDAGATTAVIAVTDGVDRDEKTFAISVQDLGSSEGGTPFESPLLSVSTGLTPHTVTLGDINRDGHLDLVTANLGSNTIGVMLGRGDGSFEMPMNYNTGIRPHTVALADFDRDGILDMAATNVGSNSIGIFLGNAQGTFGPRTDLPLSGSPIFLGIADFDRDGVPDIVSTDQTNGSVDMLLGRGDGTFAPPVEYATGAKCHGLAIGDIDRDGIPDVLVCNQGPRDVSVFLGAVGGTLVPKGRFTTSAPHTVTLGDWNGDGILDAAVANFDSSTVSLLRGRGDGTFVWQQDFFSGAGIHSASIRDIDGDGVADLISVNQIANTASFFMGRGGGTFAQRVDFSNGRGAHSIATGDLNEDGALDVAVSNINSNTVTFFLNRRPRPAPPLGARVFFLDRDKALPLGARAKELFRVEIEPVEGSYELADVLPESVSLLCDGLPESDRIFARAGKAIVGSDRDRNGVLELSVGFEIADLEQVLAGLRRGPHVVGAMVEGALRTGRTFRGSARFRVLVTGAVLSAKVSPNPFNPDAKLSFTTLRPGRVLVTVYSLDGRLVRTLIDAPVLEPGNHEVNIQGRGPGSPPLASGVYFYRVATPDGVAAGRFTVTK